MSLSTIRRPRLLAMAGTALLGALILGAPPSARGETLVGLTAGNQLAVFDSASPNSTFIVDLTGAIPGDTIRSIDFRPSNGTVYAFGTSTQTYTISPTGVLTAVGPQVLPGIGFTGVDIGIDFNPMADRLRIVTNADRNLRITPGTGPIDQDPNITFTSGVSPNLVEVAYTNNVTPAPSATNLYGIDSNTDSLYQAVNGLNSGNYALVGALNTGFNLTSLVGFDISGATGVAYAALTSATGNTSQLFTVNLATGAATGGAFIGGANSGLVLRGLTATPGTIFIPEPGTFAMMGLGLAGVAGLATRRLRRA